MPVLKKELWSYEGQSYPTELQAVNAGLKDIGEKLVRGYATNPRQGLIDLGPDITALWIRFTQITKGE